MIYDVKIIPRTFHFKQPAGTSRGVYTVRKSWFIELTSPDMPGRKGVGECAPLPDLSVDYDEDYMDRLQGFCEDFRRFGRIDYEGMRGYPSMLFGLEMALAHFDAGSLRLWNTPFSRGEEGIPINGLVWMGNFEEMQERIEEKLALGFRCVKLKIGAIDFDSELSLIKHIRKRFSSREVELRLDANGAFVPSDALYKLELLSQYAIHSIEQPIKPHRWGDMAKLCRESPLPIALDEELIGIDSPDMKAYMLNVIKPAYVILKPSLHGGVRGIEEWLEAARERGVGTWITCALESNVGLNAIAQLAARVYGPAVSMPQGLGTGMLFTDNVDIPIVVKNDEIWYDAHREDGNDA